MQLSNSNKGIMKYLVINLIHFHCITLMIIRNANTRNNLLMENHTTRSIPLVQKDAFQRLVNNIIENPEEFTSPSDQKRLSSKTRIK